MDPGSFSTLDEASPLPRDEARDLALLESAEADIAFLPEVSVLYPADDMTRVSVEGLTRQLEGASRPGHLDGLTTVMMKLIQLVGPARIYLGQKHAQQVVILRRMMQDLFMHADLVICPTVRDDDGLALSSANAQLSIEQRHAATCLYAALRAASRCVRKRRAFRRGAARTDDLRHRRRADGASRLHQRRRCRHPCRAPTGHRPRLAMLAVWIGRARFADNAPLGWEVL